MDLVQPRDAVQMRIHDFRFRLCPKARFIIRMARVTWWSLSSICTFTPRRCAAMSAFATGIRSKEYTAILMIAPRRV